MARRLSLATALLVTVVAGLASRSHPVGLVLWDKYAGDALYAVAAYLVLASISRWPPRWVAVVTFATCAIVEVLQVPFGARFDDRPLTRYLFGTVFSVWDVAAYLVGVVAIWAVDERVFSRAPVADPDPVAATAAP